MANPKTALVLSGGGARAAYQVGVLAAIRDMLPERRRNPFPILCGTSAGAINATALAVYCQDFDTAVDNLLHIWAQFHVAQVYRSDLVGIAGSGARWWSTLMFGWLVRQNPRSLLDNRPLRELLGRVLNFSRIDQAIESGALHALSITASGYTSGHSIAFFEAATEVQTWKRTQQMGARVKIGVDHLMASSAIPFIFPAAKVNREYFGDGSMRQTAPLSPAIHLGAERILVIGAGRMTRDWDRKRSNHYPSLAQIAGHALSSIFLDNLTADMERLQSINRSLAQLPHELRQSDAFPLRHIESLLIAPSQRLDLLAAQHVKSLPRTVRAMLGGIGAMRKNGAALASYLLFEQPYTQALIDLGYQDALARRRELLLFLAAEA